jgi:hypothetical protein
MSQNNIKIYGRVRPLKSNSKLKSTQGRYFYNTDSLTFHVSRGEQATINNQRESFDFKFDGVFCTEVGQEEVFDLVAKPVVNSVLEVSKALNLGIQWNYIRLRTSVLI